MEKEMEQEEAECLGVDKYRLARHLNEFIQRRRNCESLFPALVML